MVLQLFAFFKYPSFSTFGSAFGRATRSDADAAYAARVKNRTTNFDAFRLSNRDVYSYKHYRKSNAVSVLQFSIKTRKGSFH